MTRWISFFLLLAFGFGARAKTAYVGVAGSGAGQGIMGHVFLLIADQPDEILNATYFQYAIKVPPDFQMGITNITSLGDFPFIVDTGRAWPFIKNYTYGERVVLLYQLNLTDDAVAKIEAAALADRQRRQDLSVRDYSVDASNCATKVFDLINLVLPEEQKIYYLSARKAFFSYDLLHASRIAMAIPLSAAERLAQSPLVVKTLRFRPHQVVELEIIVTAFEKLQPLVHACEVSEGLQNVIEEMFANPSLRHSEHYLKLFKGAFAQCAERFQLESVYNAHLDFLRYDTDDSQFLDLSKQFYMNIPIHAAQ